MTVEEARKVLDEKLPSLGCLMLLKGQDKVLIDATIPRECIPALAVLVEANEEYRYGI